MLCLITSLNFQQALKEIENYKVGHFFIAEVSCFAARILTQLLWQKDISRFVFKDRVIKYQEQRQENDTGQALRRNRVSCLYMPRTDGLYIVLK